MDAWIPGATVIQASRDGGSMTGRDAYAVWHTTSNDPADTTAAAIARYLERVGYQVHLVWNPVTGETVQMLPPDRAGRGLENPPGGVQTNRQGRHCIQIEVVGRAADPFTRGPLVGLAPILAALRDLGVPDTWPSGRPLPASQAYGANGTRSVDAWNGPGGHFSHSQIPGNDHADPGCIDIRRLLAPSEEDAMAKPLICAYQDAQWIVAPDWSHRMGVVDEQSLLAALETGQYHPSDLSDAQLAAIPEVHA